MPVDARGDAAPVAVASGEPAKIPDVGRRAGGAEPGGPCKSRRPNASWGSRSPWSELTVAKKDPSKSGKPGESSPSIGGVRPAGDPKALAPSISSREVLVLYDPMFTFPDNSTLRSFPGVVPLSWKEATGESRGRLFDYRYLVCLPCRHPYNAILASDLMKCMRGGARILILVNESPGQPGSGSSTQTGADAFVQPLFNSSRGFLNKLLGVDVVYEMARKPPMPASGAPTEALRWHFEKYPCHFRIDRDATRKNGHDGFSFSPLMECGLTRRVPTAAAGVFGGLGEWAILPWREVDLERIDLQQLLNVIDALDDWPTRQHHGAPAEPGASSDGATASDPTEVTRDKAIEPVSASVFKPTARQLKVWKYIHRCGQRVTHEDIAFTLKMGKTTVQNAINELKRRGILRVNLDGSWDVSAPPSAVP